MRRRLGVRARPVEGDVLSPLIRNLGLHAGEGRHSARGAAAVHGQGRFAHPAAASSTSTSATSRTRNFIGQISHLGDMVPVMAGVTLVVQAAEGGARGAGLRRRRRHLHRRVPRGHQLRRGPALPAGRDRGEQRLRLLHSHPQADGAAPASRTRRSATAFPGVRADGNDVVATYQVTKEAVDRARRGEGVTLIELMTYRRKGHAEHDNQRYVPAGRDRALGPRERSARPLT